MPENLIIAVDVETTGLSPAYGARVIEVAAVKITATGELMETFSTLINPGVRIPQPVTNVHGITNAMLHGQPTPPQAWQQFADFIEHHTLIAHNAPFDMRFIRHEYQLLKIPFTNYCHCTLKLSRQKYPELGSHALENLARHVLGTLPPKTKLHRALSDAMLTAMVWGKMKGK